MRILMVASEAVPFAKTGGLADVAGALPRALARLGHEVEVVIPRYRGVTAGERVGRITVGLGPRPLDAGVYAVFADGVRTVFIDQPAYFDRDGIYGTQGQDFADNPERFAFLAHAALRWAALTGARYDVIHAHDWQAGLIPVILSMSSPSVPSLTKVPVVFTIHNLAYQGVFEAEWLPRLGLGGSLMRMDGLEYWGRISFLKAGIVFSHMVTTVSPRYAEEIQTAQFGFGFDGILRERAGKLVGIVNGIDYDQWNPAIDPHLPEPFDADHLEGKVASKRRVLEVFGFPVNETTLARPLIGMVSRLVDQKGFDLLQAAADELPGLGASFVLLGTGDRRYEDLWRGLARRFPDVVAAHIGFDEGLAHLIEGGSDIFLMPSQFEPCGLNQMYSLRYGTVPLVRATGGLYDTVSNYDAATGEGTGFTFHDYSPDALLGTLRWALAVYRDRDAWRRLQRAGMQRDHSWDSSARAYVSVYERARTSS
ncbi:MAG TPA: glycogen synthase GlgA [Vicinamibacterales bacterium]|jgi:starch synthase|nr:glycogen synthase GlgA [Vicinamibacterales bacterium]